MLKENQVYGYEMMGYKTQITIIREVIKGRWMTRNTDGKVCTLPESVIKNYIEKGIYKLVQ